MIHSHTQDGYPIEIPSKFRSYKIIQYLGCGGTCAVFLIQDENTQDQLTAKIISKKDVSSRHIINSVYNEVQILKTVDHPNIIKIYDFFEIKNDQEEEYFVIIMEYCKNGNLMSYAVDHGFNSETEKKKIVKKFLEAIKYLHDHGISHGDIKSENILLDENFSPKLCDFGFCKNRQIAGDESKTGTLYYAAPELFGKGQFDTLKSDIYAIGITLYSMNELCFPYLDEDDDSITKAIINGNLDIGDVIDEKLKKLIEKCTSLNPKSRPSIEDILHDEYFNESSMMNKDNNYAEMKISSYKNIEMIAPIIEM